MWGRAKLVLIYIHAIVYLTVHNTFTKSASIGRFKMLRVINVYNGRLPSCTVIEHKARRTKYCALLSVYSGTINHSGLCRIFFCMLSYKLL